MNKLSFDEPVWLASDIHLGPDNPRTSETFYRFLDHARSHATALILLGDIFDVWIGDDWTRKPPVWLDKALQNLRQTGHAIPLWIVRGNRDFLIGEDLATYLNARLIPDQCILEIRRPGDSSNNVNRRPARQRFLLAHGDEFCTRDLRYQRFRRIVRNPVVQSCFLALPLPVRNLIAQRARKTSQQTSRNPYDSSYDVQDQPLARLLHALNLQTCIHGHTHRPGHYSIQDSSESELSRWVLPDWELDHTHEIAPYCADTVSPENAPDKEVIKISDVSAERSGWMQIDHNGPALFALSQLVEPQIESP